MAAAPAAAPAEAPAVAARDIKMQFDPNTHDCVTDLRGLCRLPADPDDEGVATFRVFILPKGHTVHVPGKSGSYACYGRACFKTSICTVHFHAETKRQDELLIAFVDYGMLSNGGMSGMYVMSLQLPLQKARNVFEETPRYTSIKDVCGFSPIKVSEQPWCALLQPALERQQICKDTNVYKPADIYAYMSKVPLASRLDTLEATANTDIAKLVSDLARQDQRAAEKAKAKFTSRLQANMQFFRNLGLDKYGGADRDRLIKVNDSTTGVEWLNTPLRQSLQGGDARLISTAVRHISRTGEPKTPPEKAEKAKAAPVNPEHDEDDEFIDLDAVDLGAESLEQETTAAQPDEQPPRTKRTRTVPIRLEAEVAGTKKAKPGPKGKGKVCVCLEIAITNDMCVHACRCVCV